MSVALQIVMPGKFEEMRKRAQQCFLIGRLVGPQASYMETVSNCFRGVSHENWRQTPFSTNFNRFRADVGAARLPPGGAEDLQLEMG